ncbi:NAD(+) synthase [Victivallis vadensis]|uniref:NAD(+) synthase n=1 Tax=Victivallis vadensis TaxID=172901 RepID=UPI00266B41D5|nr:NAD(+) synthase [Victivallis vadensis]
MFGFYRLAAAVPVIRVADVEFNLSQMLECYREACVKQAAAVVFPELSVTGYSCGDLFFQERLLERAESAAAGFAKATAGQGTVAIFGFPLKFGEGIYNVAAVAQNGMIRGLVPKSLLPNYREFYEKRHFRSGAKVAGELVGIDRRPVPFGSDLWFDGGRGFRFAVELCEDLWGVRPPSSGLALAGARAIFNLSAGTELASKAAYRRDLVKQQSARCLAAYVLASAGVHESTSDVVFGGHALIADNGRLAAENRRFDRGNSVIYADVDFGRLGAARCSESSFNDNEPLDRVYRRVELEEAVGSPDLEFAYNPPRPFVPEGAADRRERCLEIFDIQCAGLAKRIEHTHAKTMVIGISGGLDSTLALLVAAECCKLLGRPASDIAAFTMPGFGTTGRTYNNAVKLCKLLGVMLREVDIRPACLRHFEDIGHDPAVLDTAYENVQARERTQILMDVANKSGGMVVGTGDLSEIALGWSTYNGDHMSMYAVNCSIPKTLIRFLIETTAERAEPELAAVLRDVIDTPVSPELLPAAEDGTINQKTEDLIGPYELHDFFLYHFIKYGAEPEKIRFLAGAAFEGSYPAELIDRTLATFLRRFFQQQFKRNCIPDGPKVGTISLSPRGDWRMPADASFAAWR